MILGEFMVDLSKNFSSLPKLVGEWSNNRINWSSYILTASHILKNSMNNGRTYLKQKNKQLIRNQKKKNLFLTIQIL